MMGRPGGEFRWPNQNRGRRRAGAGVAACAGGPSATMYDLSAAEPPPARALRAQIASDSPPATANLDSDRILVPT